jgi:hypothetical protein
MRIGLDLDGLLDEAPAFFAFLRTVLRSAGHFLAVLTYRDHEARDRTQAQLAGWEIGYDELHFVRSLQDKGRPCRELDLDVYFDGSGRSRSHIGSRPRKYVDFAFVNSQECARIHRFRLSTPVTRVNSRSILSPSRECCCAKCR